jgi:hypothetical protein
MIVWGSQKEIRHGPHRTMRHFRDDDSGTSRAYNCFTLDLMSYPGTRVPPTPIGLDDTDSYIHYMKRVPTLIPVALF